MHKRFNVPPGLVGPFYMVWSCLLFVCLWVLIRIATETMHPFIVILFRSVFALMALAPFFWREGRSALKTSRFGLHALRGLFATFATFSIFYAVSVVPLADLVAITYAAPVFATLGAVVMLGERIRMRRIMSTFFGFLGVMIVLRPGVEALTPGVMIGLFGSIAIAGSLLTIKTLTATEKPQAIVAYSLLFVVPAALIAAAYVWRMPTWEELALLALIGILVSMAQTALTHAFLHGEATQVLPFDFVRLILASLFGIFLFNEPVDLWTWVGGAVILASTIYTAFREARDDHRAPKAGSFG
ncbi:MAG: DMT family transporter [Proteobacteria bacterium]|nr:DMT family transporter [Pseudomonadota bacterium]